MAQRAKPEHEREAKEEQPEAGELASRPSGAEAGIDEILGGLEHVVKELESGELPLERALQRFEEGVRLARRGSALLDAVEERVERLLADGEEVVPFETGAAPSNASQSLEDRGR